MTGTSNTTQDYRFIRTAALTIIYLCALLAARWLAFLIRFDFTIPGDQIPNLFSGAAWQPGLELLMLLFFGQMYGILRYFSIPDFIKINVALAIASIITLLIRLLLPYYGEPRGVILLNFFFAVGSVSVVRLAIRFYWEQVLSKPIGKQVRVGIIGAGDVGAHLAREMQGRRSMGMAPVIFVDDDSKKWNLNVHGVPIVGKPEALARFVRQYSLDKAVIAMPGASATRIGEIVKLLNGMRLPYETVPSMFQLASGQVSVSRLRPVEIDDLLGREMVSLDHSGAGELIRDRIVAVTGGGGSIGSELCRQILSYNPRQLLIIEQSEPSLFQIEQELISMSYGGIILPIVADILDAERMRAVFAHHRPSTLFHAAAHKHVPMMEHQPGEAIKNNTFGTACLANLALEFKMERFVLISTDKAINPTNVMGATKRMAEIYVQSLHAANPNRTKFMAVRFGNVLGSSGSVIPTFKKQIEAGGPVKVTHPEIQRYFMTIPEAVGLVLQSAVIGAGGEIFVLDMGKPVKIVDLARQMIELSGYIPDEDIKIEFTGIRPGEKLFEELSNKAENHIPTSHPKIARFVTTPLPFDEVKAFLDRIEPQVNTQSRTKLKEMIREMVPEYKPFVD